MPLIGKFEINNADYSPLTFYGIGTFLAFSGDGIYKNRGGCGAVPDNGPIPPGKYWIVDRPTGNWKNRCAPGPLMSSARTGTAYQPIIRNGSLCIAMTIQSTMSPGLIMSDVRLSVFIQGDCLRDVSPSSIALIFPRSAMRCLERKKFLCHA